MFPSEIQNLHTYCRLVIQGVYLKLYVWELILNNFLTIIDFAALPWRGLESSHVCQYFT